MSLTNEELIRYSRQTVLLEIGLEGQEKLKNAKVSVVGVGGLGCVSSIQLAAMGVGYIRITDQDVVDLTNLHRQYLYDTAALGYPKVEVAQKRLKAMNPNVEVEALPLTITRDTAEEVVKGVDVVVDALDRFAPRYAINEACVRNKIPYIYGGVLSTYGNVSTIIPGETACLECIVGKVDEGSLPTCETAGVFPPVISIIASVQVREASYMLLGKQPLLSNKLFFVDTQNLEFESFNIIRRPGCETCGETSIKARPISSDLKVVELCGKNSFIVSPKSSLTIDLNRAAEILGSVFKLKTRAAFGLTFDYSELVSVSLMKTGNMLIKGVSNEKEALLVYDKVITTVSS
ncbi:HesA/MoeB/ThiF family protein [Candidatus Bathyarchaeota archaeon]|nr:HesA/MoeB/ThiF family protein [Candidatus Bathyarchaeota archaeon]